MNNLLDLVRYGWAIFTLILAIIVIIVLIKEYIYIEKREMEIQKRRNPEKYIKEMRKKINAIEEKIKKEGIEEEPKAAKDEEMPLLNKIGKVMKLNCMGEGGIYFSTDTTREWIDPFEINRLNGLLHGLRSANYIFKCVMVVDPMEVLGVDDWRLLMNKRTSCGLSDDLVQFQVNSQLVEDIISIRIYSLMIDHDIPQYIEHGGNQLYIEDILEKDVLINGEYKPVIVLITKNIESRYPDDKRLAYTQLSIGLPYCIDMTKTFNRFLYNESNKKD